MKKKSIILALLLLAVSTGFSSAQDMKIEQMANDNSLIRIAADVKNKYLLLLI